MIDLSADPLARFLPTHCDARLISHYLALLSDNEVRLKRQLEQAQQEIQQLKKSAAKASEQTSSVINKTPPAPVPTPPQTPPTKSPYLDIGTTLRPVEANKAYQDGLKFFDRNELDRAITHFHHANGLGHPEAKYMLGECYYFFHQLEESLKWYRRAAQDNHPEALYSLGYIYYYGEGVKEDTKKALDFLRRAEAAGSAHAKELRLEISRR